jgi:hypothetical protein
MRRQIGAATGVLQTGDADLAKGHSLSEFDRLLPGTQFIQVKVRSGAGSRLIQLPKAVSRRQNLRDGGQGRSLTLSRESAIGQRNAAGVGEDRSMAFKFAAKYISPLQSDAAAASGQ